VPGKELKVFDSPFGKIGINICFDSAFSEVWRVLALRGAPLIVNVSAVPKTFPVDYMWRRFRGAALFNQVFVVYANRPGNHFSGHSAVFNPQGDILVSAGPKEAVIEAVIDLSAVDRWRDEERVYPSRRPLLYREIVKKQRDDLQLIANK
jgi:predicted amidohydrolase